MLLQSCCFDSIGTIKNPVEPGGASLAHELHVCPKCGAAYQVPFRKLQYPLPEGPAYEVQAIKRIGGRNWLAQGDQRVLALLSNPEVWDGFVRLEEGNAEYGGAQVAELALKQTIDAVLPISEIEVNHLKRVFVAIRCPKCKGAGSIDQNDPRAIPGVVTHTIKCSECLGTGNRPNLPKI